MLILVAKIVSGVSGQPIIDSGLGCNVYGLKDFDNFAVLVKRILK